MRAPADCWTNYWGGCKLCWVCLQEQQIGAEEYEALCKGIRNFTPPPITDELSRWVNETQWSALQPLTQIPVRSLYNNNSNTSAFQYVQGKSCPSKAMFYVHPCMSMYIFTHKSLPSAVKTTMNHAQMHLLSVFAAGFRQHFFKLLAGI